MGTDPHPALGNTPSTPSKPADSLASAARLTDLTSGDGRTGKAPSSFEATVRRDTDSKLYRYRWSIWEEHNDPRSMEGDTYSTGKLIDFGGTFTKCGAKMAVRRAWKAHWRRKEATPPKVLRRSMPSGKWAA